MTRGRLCSDLRALSNAALPTQLQIERLQDRVADLVLRALFDERHQLAEDLAALTERAGLERKGTLYSDAAGPETGPDAMPPRAKNSDPARHLFMPQPGASDPEARRLWPAQLLLQAAARSPLHHARLAGRLGLTVGDMQRTADAAPGAASAAAWSQRQYVQFLEPAVTTLDAQTRRCRFGSWAESSFTATGGGSALARRLRPPSNC